MFRIVRVLLQLLTVVVSRSEISQQANSSAPAGMDCCMVYSIRALRLGLLYTVDSSVRDLSLRRSLASV